MDLTELAKEINNASSVVVLTGAGISAESGIPTFRDAQTGLWSQYQATELATPKAFQNNPKLVWEWYQWRRDLIDQAQPNPGHRSLVELEALVDQFTLITQNVDGFHRLAGSPNVIELHGNITKTICFNNRHPVDTWEIADTPPRCPVCDSYLRPDVVWFGEMLPHDALEKAFHASLTCDVFFAIGTSGVVEPAASLPRLARENDAVIVEINITSTPLTHQADFVIHQPSGEFLPQLVSAIKNNA